MIEIVRLTSIPIIAEASVSWATARIALPCLVEVTNQVRIASAGMMIASATTSFHVIRTSPIVIAAPCGMMSEALS